ncbi:hypothetical protein BKA64DRAFT_717579 [Cadophora sp. MPI-SDFR-AT-0126]|nr:hypothetical protein BKA64DRAFT_717579 [Leotiomycetes sp. MPI-SDFR-AT-0126]
MASTASKKRAAGEHNDNDSPAKKVKREMFLESLGAEIVDIHVGQGPQQKHFKVHKALLCSKIPYFDKMFNSDFREGKENVAKLPEDDPESFDILLEWVYTGSLPRFRYTKQEWGVDKNFNHYRLFDLVDKICLKGLKDQIVGNFIDTSDACNVLPGFGDIADIVNKLPETSSIRQYHVLSLLYIIHGLPRTDVHLKVWPTRGLSDLLVGHPKVALAYAEAVRNLPLGSVATDPRKMPRCNFHEHGESEKCPAKSTD